MKRAERLSRRARWLLMVPPLLAASCSEPPPPSGGPYLWRVQGSGTEYYLFGLLDVPDERVTVLPAPAREALSRADAVYTEVEVGDSATVAMARASALRSGDNLIELLPEELRLRVETWVYEHSVPMEQVEPLKPWAAAQLLVSYDAALEADELPSHHIARMAHDADKAYGGLASVTDQAGVFDGLSEPEQLALLAGTMHCLERCEREGHSAREDLIEAYCSGRDAALLDLSCELSEAEADATVRARVRRRLRETRNEHLAKRIRERVERAADRVHFFALPADRLIGPDGIIARLQRYGHRAARIGGTEAELDPPQAPQVATR
ncbi:MAG: TraB/GumN family protein [Planctomycetota bacterium]